MTTNNFLQLVLYFLYSSSCLAPILHHKVTVGLVQREVGWECMGGAMFLSKAAAGWPPPPPKPTHLPSHTLFCPINWHTPLATPSKASQMGWAKCTWSAGVWWEHPVWVKFTCPFSTPVTCALKENQQPAKKMFIHRNCTAKLIVKNTAAFLNASGDFGSFLTDNNPWDNERTSVG